MGFQHAPVAWMNGVTVGTADIEDLAVTVGKLAGSITNAKLTNSEYVVPLLQYQVATPAAGSTFASVQLYEAAEIVEVCYSCKENGTGSGSTIIDVHAGANAASAVSIFASARLNCKVVSTLKTAAPSGTKGVVPDNGYIRIDIDAVASGTKSNGCVTVWGKRSLTT